MEDRNLWSPRWLLLKGPFMGLLGFTPSELQHRSSSLKDTRGIQEELKYLASGVELGGKFLPHRSASRSHCSFCEPSPHRAGRQVPYLRLQNPGSHCLPHSSDSMRLYSPNFWAHPSYLQWLFRMNSLSWLMLQIFLNSLKQAAYGLKKPHIIY